MSARSLLVTAMVLLIVAPARLFAQDQVLPEVGNEKYQLAGEINATNVYIRSGPSDNYYPTLKLDKGAKVVAVGQKFDWLKILPPEGSFSYVAKVYVERRGDGSVGRVTRPDLLVKAGSSLNAMKTALQTKLDENTDVTILGEQDEYFKIKPPKDAYVYVNKQFVTLKAVAGDSEPAPSSGGVLTQGDAPSGTGPVAVAANNTTDTTEAAVVAVPATQPAVAAAELAFDQAEADFLAASKQPLEQQQVAPLLARYQELVKKAELPASMLRIAEHRQRTLEIRAEAQAELASAKMADEVAQQRLVPMRAEREELVQRINEQEIKIYTAVGTLRTSSLQSGKETLYRLTDPATGRTLVYLRSNDAKLVQQMGQFIGVRGEVTTDAQMNIKIIAPTGVEAVDAGQVPAKVAAQIMPASMIAKAPSASAND